MPWLQRHSSRIERFLAENEPRIGRMDQEVQSNVTDNESAKMKSSHGIMMWPEKNGLGFVFEGETNRAKKELQC